MFMFFGILAVLLVFIMIKSCKVAAKYLAISFPICCALCYGSTLAIMMQWWDINYNYEDNEQNAQWYLMEYMIESIIYLTAIFMIGYWPISYIVAI